MTSQFEQLIFVVGFMAAIFVLIKLPSKKYFYFKVFIVGTLFTAFFFNPFRMTVPQMTTVHLDGASNFNNTPDKVIVEITPSFDDFNKSEMGKLNKLNEVTKSEIHN